MKRASLFVLVSILGLYFVASLGVPLVFLVRRAFSVQGEFSLANYAELLQSQSLTQCFLNSLAIAIWSSALAVITALPMAQLAVRRTLRRRGLFDLCVLAPLFMPPMVGVLGVKAMASRSGTINSILQSFGAAPMNLLSPGSPWGVIVVQTIHFYPLVYLSLAAALSRLNPELEEAAESLGCSRLRTFFSITLPLLAPAMFGSGLLVFIGSFTDIGTPLLFEYREAVPVKVLDMLTDPHGSGSGFALVVGVGAVSTALFFVSRWFERSSNAKSDPRLSRRLTAQSLKGRADAVWLAVCVAICVISVVPHLGVVVQALSGRWFMTALPSEYTTSHLREVFSHPVAARSLVYSIVLSVVATVLCVLIGGVIAWRAVRRNTKIDVALEALAMLPLSIPGIVIAFGLMIGYSGTFLDNTKNPTILLILAYSVRRLPYVVRLVASALRQGGSELEEAALSLGASVMTTLRRITLPLVAPALAGAAVLCFIGSLLEVSDSLILAVEERFYPIAKALYALQAGPDGVPVASSLALIVLAIVIIGFLIATRLTGRSLSQLFLSVALMVLALRPGAAVSEELVILSPHWEGYKREFEWGFVEWCQRTYSQPITVRWFDVGGASDILTYVTGRARAGQPSGADVIFGGGVDMFVDLRSRTLIRPVHPHQSVLAGIPDRVQGNPVYDPEGYWYSVNLAGFGIVVNRPIFAKLRVPEPVSWEDLGQPSLRGWIGSADPRKSGSVRFIYELLLQFYGWEKGWGHIYEIASNVRSFTAQSSQTPKDISFGEIAAGMLIDSYGRDLVRELGAENVAMVIPERIPSVFGDAVAILQDARNATGAERFIEYVLSEDAQKLLMLKRGAPGGPRQFELGRYSVRPRLYERSDLVEGMESPFRAQTEPFSYDSSLASARWRHVTALLGAVAVDLRPLLETARYELGQDLRSYGPPISEADLAQAIAEGQSPQQVAHGAAASLRATIPVKHQWGWNVVTILLSSFALVILGIRRVIRRLKSRRAVLI